MKSNTLRNSLLFIAILIAAIVIFSIFYSQNNKPAQVTITAVINLSQQQQIQKIEVDGATLNITETNGTQVQSNIESNAKLSDYESLGLNLSTGDAGKPVTVDVKAPSGIDWGSILINFLPLVIMLGLILLPLPFGPGS